ncbi:MAG: AI-2E family transporter [Deltaproteobacteria bacterium]|nr:AI-2E family transporter [Deltaproteobacteria bacterium]
MIPILKEWQNRYFSDPQIVILGFLLLVGFVFIFLFGNMLIPVFASIVIAYLLEGIVSMLQRCRIPRIASVISVFLLFLACLLILIVALLPMLSRQIGQFLQELPSMMARGQNALMLLPEKYPDLISEPQIRHILNLIGSELTSLGQRILSLSLASVRGLITILVYLILVPLLVFFFLKDKKKILKWLTGFLPDNRGLAVEVWREANVQVANYVRGKIWEIIIVWGVSYITFTLLELRFSMLLSLFVGLSVLIPYIGATVMFLPVTLIAYFQWNIGSTFVYTLIAYTIIQILDGNLLVPLLLSEVVNLHPVAIIVALLLFGGLWGIWGLFFAIPLATLVHAIIKAWFNQSSVGKDVEENIKSEN